MNLITVYFHNGSFRAHGSESLGEFSTLSHAEELELLPAFAVLDYDVIKVYYHGQLTLAPSTRRGISRPRGALLDYGLDKGSKGRLGHRN